MFAQLDLHYNFYINQEANVSTAGLDALMDLIRELFLISVRCLSAALLNPPASQFTT